MNEYKLLLKTVLTNSFRSSKTKYIDDKVFSKKKKTLTTVAIIFTLAIGFGSLIGGIYIIAHLISLLCALGGLSVELMSMLLASAQIAVLFFGVQSVLSNTFFSKDNEFLAQLPIKPQMVFMVKMTVIYLNELLITTFMLLPMVAGFISGSLVGGYVIPWFFYVFVPVMLLSAPVVPLVLVSIVSFPLIKVVTYFKNRSIMTLIVSVLSFGVFMLAYFLLIPNMEKFFTFSGQASLLTPQFISTVKGIGTITYWNYALVKAATGTKVFLNLLIFLLINVGGVAVIVLLSAKLYQKAASSTGETSGQKKNTEIVINESSRKKMLLMREFKTLFRDTSFAFNSVMGCIMTPLIVALMSYMSGGKWFFGTAIDETTMQFVKMGFILFYTLMMLCGFNYGASLAFTRDGGTFYVLRYLPVSIEEIFNAKVSLANAISAVGTVLTLLVSVFVVKITVLFWLPMIIMIALYCYGFNLLCVYRDLKRPNVNWTNAYEAIKKNFYPMIPMFIAAGVGIVLMLGTQYLPTVKGLSPVCQQLIFWTIGYLGAGAVIVLLKVLIGKNIQTFFDRVDCGLGG